MPKIFKPRINPAFYRFPVEAAIVGRIVVAFGELEYLTVVCAGRAINQRERISRALYRLRNTSSRIDAADEMMRPSFDQNPLRDDYIAMMTAIRHCLQIRNQYAHCNWADAEDYGLFFVDLQYSARSTPGVDFNYRHVDVTLLERQEEFFANTQTYLYYFEYLLSVIQGPPIHPEPLRPLVLALPPLHNPPDQHVPPWLSEDQKALHLARALAASGGPPTPTPQQRALDKARAEKHARLAEIRRKSAAGEARAKSRSLGDPPESK